jgi:hypothetical protein
MKKKLVVGLTALTTLGVAAPVASAEYYMPRDQAERIARYEVHDRYGTKSHIATVCRPQGLKAPERGYIYHRWVCGWADDSMRGVLLIMGSHASHNSYYVKVVVAADSY